MSDGKYLPLKVSLPDRTTGELREFELSYANLTMARAYRAERELRYLDSAIHQWLELLKQVVQRDAEQGSYAIKKEERMTEALKESK